MNDLSDVNQPSILLQVTSQGSDFQSVRGWHVSAPPPGCESQQLFDHMLMVFTLGAAVVAEAHKLRMLEAYALRWSIPVEHLEDAEFRRRVSELNGL